MSAGWVVAIGSVCFLFGVFIGTRIINAVRLEVWRRVDGLIHLIEEVAGLTPDGRINPAVPLQQLYDLRQWIRIPGRDERLQSRE